MPTRLAPASLSRRSLLTCTNESTYMTDWAKILVGTLLSVGFVVIYKDIRAIIISTFKLIVKAVWSIQIYYLKKKVDKYDVSNAEIYYICDNVGNEEKIPTSDLSDDELLKLCKKRTRLRRLKRKSSKEKICI